MLVAQHATTGDRRVLARGPAAGFEAADLPEPELVDWASVGGRVPGRLYRPASAHGGLILWVHGGPTDQATVVHNVRLAFLLDRGWTILVPDYRGSTGWGRAYAQALRGGWGEADVADCAAGLDAAATQGWGDPHRLVPAGTSAGGMTVLLLMARHGERCAAGIAISAVADLVALASTTHRFEAHYSDALIGPLPDAAARYRERSPITVADRIERPLLLLHGQDDKVVPVVQAEEMGRRLRDRGAPVELHTYPGEGHGWRDPATVEDELHRIDDFLTRHANERNQRTAGSSSDHFRTAAPSSRGVG